MQDPIVIVSYARTPSGAFQGTLAPLSATDLGSVTIRAACERATLKPTDINEVFMGCVLPAGLGQAPARQAALKAGLPNNVACSTVNKMCGSAMQAIVFAHNQISANPHEVIIAGGMESMSNAPYLLPDARQGYRMGHSTVVDHMFFDGLEDAYDKGKLMGVFADQTAEKFGFSREAQDAFALASLERTNTATKSGWFTNEIIPVTVPNKKGPVTLTQDEPPTLAKPEKIPTLKPAFTERGTVTAANSSSIADGAAAVVLMRQSEAKRRGIKPIAAIHSLAVHSQEPSQFTTAPIGAITAALKRATWSSAEVDLFEINEAFAVVTMAAMQELKLPHAKVNVHGGACALGHPIGASGARIVCTLLSALQQHGKTKGLAALCIGGGEALAMTVEML